jgi:hypothetical protein
MCSAEFTAHDKFTVHSTELLVNSADNSTNSIDFCVFKKFLFLSLIKCISIKFSQISPNFFVPVEFSNPSGCWPFSVGAEPWKLDQGNWSASLSASLQITASHIQRRLEAVALLLEGSEWPMCRHQLVIANELSR